MEDRKTLVSGSKPQLDSLTFPSSTSYSLVYIYIFSSGYKNEWFYCKSKASPSSINILNLIPLRYANNSLKSCCSVAQSCLTLRDPMDCSLPGSSSMGFSRQECWSGLPFPSPGDLPVPGIEPGSLAL